MTLHQPHSVVQNQVSEMTYYMPCGIWDLKIFKHCSLTHYTVWNQAAWRVRKQN